MRKKGAFIRGRRFLEVGRLFDAIRYSVMLNTPYVFERFNYSNVLKIINIHHYANDTECSKLKAAGTGWK